MLLRSIGRLEHFPQIIDNKKVFSERLKKKYFLNLFHLTQL